jgi:transcriptional regulator with XRE-family HTH domain
MRQRFEGKLAAKILERMSDLDLTSRQLAERTSISYEHIRKLIRGLAYPSAKAIVSLSKTLKIPKSELEQLAIADRIQFKYKDSPEKIKGMFEMNPELAPLESLWTLLNKEQKKSVITFAQMLADQNLRTNSR